jgi:hypothetical protein
MHRPGALYRTGGATLGEGGAVSSTNLMAHILHAFRVSLWERTPTAKEWRLE